MDSAYSETSSECSEASLERYSEHSDASSECSEASLERYSEHSDASSECSDASLEGYSSSIESSGDDASDGDTEAEDDKLVIFNFYKTFSQELFETFSVRSMEVSASLCHLMRNYQQVSNGMLPRDIDYRNKSHCVAYLFRYAACHTALVFEAVSEILDSSSSMALSSKLINKRLNVMFLGGGPGNDFVGFLYALHDHAENLFDLDVTVVDKMSGWKDVFNETVGSLEQGNCGKAGLIFEEVNVTKTFISADLKDSYEWDEEMETKLENADVVFFVKALSHIPDGDKFQVLENVVSFMKPDSLIIYIDYPYPSGVFSLLSDQLRTVYQSCKKRYNLGYKECTFGYDNIDSCQAVVKVFQIYEN